MTTPNAGPAATSADGAVRKSREIRVGLVMYGGVSLTTYTNGVAREFHDAVRGRGVYALVLKYWFSYFRPGFHPTDIPIENRLKKQLHHYHIEDELVGYFR